MYNLNLNLTLKLNSEYYQSITDSAYCHSIYNYICCGTAYCVGLVLPPTLGHPTPHFCVEIAARAGKNLGFL